MPSSGTKLYRRPPGHRLCGNARRSRNRLD